MRSRPSSNTTPTPSCASAWTRCAIVPAKGSLWTICCPSASRLVRETGKRTMGMRHFDVQMIGGMVLHDGCIAEMKTGEGKTLTATLAVVLNSLAVRSTRDPEAAEDASAANARGCTWLRSTTIWRERDAEWMSPIYDALGVSVGVLQNMQPYEEKQAAYACDVVYGTNSEFGFDYLRDNMAKDLSEKVQRGHCVRDRGRGRQHPDRRGAHAADHLRRARTGRGPVREVRAAGAADEGRRDARRHGSALQEAVPGRLRLRDRREAQDGRRSPSRASPRPSGSSASTTCIARRTAISSTT